MPLYNPIDGSDYTPLPSGTPIVGQIPTVTDDDPLTLVWGAGGGSLPDGSVTQHSTHPGLLVYDAVVAPPANYAPEVTISSAVAEDLDVTVTWTGTDADDDPLTYSVDWGDTQTTDPATSPATHTYAAGGDYTITVTADDGTTTGTDTAAVTAVDPAAGSPYHLAVVADSPVVYYPLDDASNPAVDATGASTASSTAWPTFAVTGIGDGTTACDFPASGSTHVAYGQPAGLNNITGDFTFEFIIQPDSNAESKSILARDDGASARSYSIQRVNQTFRFQALNGGVVALSTTSNYPSGSIYHVVFVRSGTTLTVYVNGTSDGSTTLSASLGAPNTPHQIGAKAGGILGNVDGRLAGVAIYTTALSPARITAHYAAIGS